MGKISNKFLIILLIFLGVLIFNNKASALSFKNADREYENKIIVKYGTIINIEKSEDEILTMENNNIAKLTDNNEIRIEGVGHFKIHYKSNDSESDIEFFAWNAYLKKGKYYTYYLNSSNKAKKSDILYSKVYLAVEQSEKENYFKIKDYLFVEGGKYKKENELVGKLIASYYDAKKQKSKNSYYEYSFEKKFKPIIEVEEIKFKDADVLLKIGEEKNLNVIITPENSSDKKLNFSSGDNNIATVDENGKIIGNSVGETTIIAETENGKVAECKIKVEEVLAEKILLDKTNIYANKGDNVVLNIVIEPSNTTNKNVTYISSDENIISVSSDGTLLAKEGGIATLTVKTSNGLEAKCTVLVKTGSEFILNIGEGADRNLSEEEQMEINAKLLWQFFISYGFTEEATAGIIGNMRRESRMLPWNNVGKMKSDLEYVNKVDSGKLSKKGFIYTSHHNGSSKSNEGFGLIQWTSTEKKTKLYEYLKERNNYSIASLQGQAEFFIESLKWENITLEYLKKSSAHNWQAKYLKGYASLIELFKNTHSIKEASDALACIYCRPGAINKGGSSRDKALYERRTAAEEWYGKLKGAFDT